MQTSSIRDFDAHTFDAAIRPPAGPVLVDFWADWCPPCRMIEPVVAEMADAYRGRLRVGRLDVDRNPEIGMRYGVMGMPTLILFIGGQPVDRLVGFSSAGQVRRWVADRLPSAAGDGLG
ncbi:MAG: thioredoxin [Candidatus Dormibacteraeota bacterium]|nr:thioredoxin [Candidatus Dormibacteraeota bacterium]